MSDISHTLIAKSDQLNAADLVGSEKLLTITSVVVKSPTEVWVHYEGQNGRPWKTSLTARRILAGLWGTDSTRWLGHTVSVYCDPDVFYAGEDVGGVRPHAATGIESAQTFKFKERRGPKPKTFVIQPLILNKNVDRPAVIEYTFEGYEKVIRSIIQETDPEKMEARFERAKDWRLKAVAENRERATELRALYDDALAALTA